VVPKGFACPTRTPDANGSHEAAAKRNRNPILIAREWRQLLQDEGLSRAELARRLGVTRARVTQMLRLLELAPSVVEVVVALGEPQSETGVSERFLRTMVGLPAGEQAHRISQVLSTGAHSQ
jgi:DNA-binding transcriptional regulator LsrR (DeoR family)